MNHGNNYFSVFCNICWGRLCHYSFSWIGTWSERYCGMYLEINWSGKWQGASKQAPQVGITAHAQILAGGQASGSEWKRNSGSGRCGLSVLNRFFPSISASTCTHACKHAQMYTGTHINASRQPSSYEGICKLMIQNFVNLIMLK